MSTDNIKKAIKIIADHMRHGGHEKYMHTDDHNLIYKLLNETPDPRFTYFYKHGDGFKEGPAPEGYDEGSGLLAEIEGHGTLVTSGGAKWNIPKGGVVTINDDGTFDISAGTGNLKEAEDAPEIPEGYEIVTEGNIQEGDCYLDTEDGCMYSANTFIGVEVVKRPRPLIRKSQPKPVIPSGWEAFDPDPEPDTTNRHSFPSDSRCYAYIVEYEKWKPCANQLFIGEYKFIRQTINIDLSKQPIELKWFATIDKIWYGFEDVAPEFYGEFDGQWGNGRTRYPLFDSQYPTWTGLDEDSLLTRPEASNE